MIQRAGGLQRDLIIGVLCLVGAAAAIGLADQTDRAILAWFLLAAVALITLTRRRRDGPVIAAVAAVVFALAVLVLDRSGDGGTVVAAVVAVAVTDLALILASLALERFVREERRVLAELGHQAQAIESLTTHDEVTGAYRPHYMQTLLDEEIERARRYKRALTLCMIAVDDWQELIATEGEAAAREALARVLTTLGSRQRLLDKIVDLGGGEIVLILPETPLEGAEVVAGRIQAQIAPLVMHPLRIGVVDFPLDAQTRDGLISEAREALIFARSANLPLVDRTLLGVE